MTITTDPSTQVSQPLTGVVQITCTADSNPLSYLSVWLVTSNVPVAIVRSLDPMESYTTAVTLAENRNEFFCRASDADGLIQVDSETVQFQDLCKYFQLYHIIVLVFFVFNDFICLFHTYQKFKAI